MLIAHLTDTHLGLDPGALGGRLDPAAALRRALARVRALAPAPAVLLLTGDLAEAGRAADYTLLAELLKQELPAQDGQAPRVLCIIGNHDHREHARRHLGALMPIAPHAIRTNRGGEERPSEADMRNSDKRRSGPVAPDRPNGPFRVFSPI